MATETVIFPMPTGLTSHTAEIYPEDSDTAAQTGLPVAEETNRDCLYAVDITTGETGVHSVHVFNSGGTCVGVWWVKLNGTAREVEATDDKVALDLSGLADEVVAAILAQSDAIIASLTGANNLERRRGDTWVLTFTLTGDKTSASDWWFSLKDHPDDSEDNAVIRASKTVGLERINKDTVAAAGLVVGDASITDSYDAGEDETTVTVTIKPAATVLVEASNENENIKQAIFPQPRTPGSLEIIASDFYYDLQGVESDVVTTHQSGQFRNRADVSQATS